MDIQKLKLVYFSPTGTTKKVILSIAREMNCKCAERIDITKPKERENILVAGEDTLLIIGVPVYMGRVPAVIEDWLHSIKAQNTPTICVVVYGNRAYENALLELNDVLTEQGCKPIAGAAFIGEHSFSSNELPSSVGRPDANDLLHSKKFGFRIKEKLNKLSSVNQIEAVKVPGEKSYGGVTELWHIDFVQVNSNCTRCGICVEGCPVGAIDPDNTEIVDKNKCTLCCACIKNCPQNAKSMKPGLMKDAAIRCTKFTDRKEPELFISF